MKKTAIADAKPYNLTPRETQVWCLYQTKYSYKQIATKLYTSINTVKKHMKNKKYLF
jgi:DNA-binding CsgD family transcriptional regulator